MGDRRKTVAAVVAALLVLGAGAAAVALIGGSGSSSPPVATGGVPALDHVAIVVMENRERGQVIGAPNAPWITKEAQASAQATHMYAIGHPSLPNYLALTGGDTFGIHDDCTSCHVDAQNIVDQLETAGVSWRAYMEGMPHPCYQPESSPGDFGGYAKRHNPFFYYDDIRSDPTRCENVVPYSQLNDDVGSLPRFIWVSPDLCHDMHDCSDGVGDRWAHEHLPALIDAMGPNSALFLTWDEGTSDHGCCGVAAGGRIPLVVLGLAAVPGASESAELDQYALLRTIDEALGLPPLGNAAGAGDLSALLG